MSTSRNKSKRHVTKLHLVRLENNLEELQGGPLTTSRCKKGFSTGQNMNKWICCREWFQKRTSQTLAESVHSRTILEQRARCKSIELLTRNGVVPGQRAPINPQQDNLCGFQVYYCPEPDFPSQIYSISTDTSQPWVLINAMLRDILYAEGSLWCLYHWIDVSGLLVTSDL